MLPSAPRGQVVLNSKSQVPGGKGEGFEGEEPSSPALVHRPQPHSFILEQLLASPSWPGLWLIPSTVSTKEVTTPPFHTTLLTITASAPCHPVSCTCTLLSAPNTHHCSFPIACHPTPRSPTGPKFLLLLLFFGVSLAIYLVPLCISSACIMEPKDLPPKPELMGHRGAPMVSVWQNAGRAGRVCSSRLLWPGLWVPRLPHFLATSSPFPAGPREHPDVPAENS